MPGLPFETLMLSMVEVVAFGERNRTDLVSLRTLFKHVAKAVHFYPPLQVVLPPRAVDTHGLYGFSCHAGKNDF